MRAREWHLVRRPRAHASPEDFALIEADVPEPGPGQVVVRNTHLSVDPYMRGRMDDRPSYVPPFPLDAPLDGAAVGVVVGSRAPGIAEGQVVEHFAGLREVTVADAAAVSVIDVDQETPAEAYLGPLGATGLSAWIGTGQVRAGDTVFVTGAAGAVGGIAGQLARLRGAGRVIGSAGSAAKVEHLKATFGHAFDEAFDYHDGDPRDHLAKLAPDGIDVVFDNVGGAQLEAAIGHLGIGARLALCGMVSQYDGGEPYGIRTLYELITRRATAHGFLVTDHLHRMPEFRAEMAGWLRDGTVVYPHTVFDGIERVPEALLALLRAGTSTTGKAVVRP